MANIERVDSVTRIAPQVAGSGVLGTSAPRAEFSTPCGRGEGWFTLALSAGALLRTTWSTARKLVYWVNRLYFRPRSVMASLAALPPSRASWSLSAAIRWRAHRWRRAAVSVALLALIGRLKRTGPSAELPSTTRVPLASPFHLPNTISGRMANRSGSWRGCTSYTSRPSKRTFTLVSTGESIILRKRAACSAASAGWVMMKGSPMPARARPSMRWRFTLEPMPNENTLALERLLRTSSKASRSTVT